MIDITAERRHHTTLAASAPEGLSQDLADMQSRSAPIATGEGLAPKARPGLYQRAFTAFAFSAVRSFDSVRAVRR